MHNIEVPIESQFQATFGLLVVDTVQLKLVNLQLIRLEVSF